MRTFYHFVPKHCMLATIAGALGKHSMTMLSHFEMVQVPPPFQDDFGQHQETVLDINKLRILPNVIMHLHSLHIYS
jgi:hypothetical protein